MIRLAILLCGGLCSLTGAAAAQEGEEGPGPGSASACTRLVLRVDRTDVVVGDAVEVRLGVENLTDSSLGLLPSDFALEVRDGAGELDDEAFVVSGPTIEGVFPGEGGPEIFPGGEAVATWTLFSTDDALTQPAPATFVLDGRAAHSHDGLHVEAAVASIELEVHPRPVLFFDHYFPEGVHADNPFSVPIVEPVEAFPLGLAVRNVGFGAASDVAVRSARPRLVDVQDGRPVRLRVLGAEVEGVEAEPAFGIALGDVPPGGRIVARWTLTSELSARFEDLELHLEHTDALGARVPPLLAETRLFPLTHVVEIQGEGAAGVEDGVADFLVNDTSTLIVHPISGALLDDVPDQLHSSEGAVFDVRFAAEPVLGSGPSLANLVVTADVTIHTPGWSYLRFPDPGGDAFRASMLVRDPMGAARESFVVGGQGDVSNAWATTRTSPPDGPPVADEHLLHHLAFFAAPGSYDYSIVYEVVPELGLTSDIDVLRLSEGGAQTLFLSAGVANAGRPYFLLGSWTGTEPGIPFGPITLPLVPDTWFQLLLLQPNLPFFIGTLGQLDAAGRAQAAIFLPPGISPVVVEAQTAAMRMYHAYMLFDPFLDFASNPVELRLVP